MTGLRTGKKCIVLSPGFFPSGGLLLISTSHPGGNASLSTLHPWLPAIPFRVFLCWPAQPAALRPPVAQWLSSWSAGRPTMAKMRCANRQITALRISTDLLTCQSQYLSLSPSAHVCVCVCVRGQCDTACALMTHADQTLKTRLIAVFYRRPTFRMKPWQHDAPLLETVVCIVVINNRVSYKLPHNSESRTS